MFGISMCRESALHLNACRCTSGTDLPCMQVSEWGLLLVVPFSLPVFVVGVCESLNRALTSLCDVYLESGGKSGVLPVLISRGQQAFTHYYF